MVNAVGYAARLFGSIAEQEIPVDMISTAESAISFTVPRDARRQALKSLRGLRNGLGIEGISSVDNIALIGVVGEGMKSTPGVAGRMFNSLGRRKVNIELISQGASEMNISFVVKDRDAEEAMRAVHEEFVEAVK
jgi:aspartate kinase